jgi:hypothetical protein
MKGKLQGWDVPSFAKLRKSLLDINCQVEPESKSGEYLPI